MAANVNVHDADWRSMSWVTLVQHYGWHLQPEIMAAAAWLDKWDRGLVTIGKDGVGRGLSLAITPLCRWITFIDPDADATTLRHGLHDLERRLREVGHPELGGRPVFERQGLFAMLLVLIGYETGTIRRVAGRMRPARGGANPFTGWSQTQRLLWWRQAHAVLYYLAIEIAYQRGDKDQDESGQKEASSADKATKRSNESTGDDQSHLLGTWVSGVRRMRREWPSLPEEYVRAWNWIPSDTVSVRDMFPPTSSLRGRQLEEVYSSYIEQHRLHIIVGLDPNGEEVVLRGVHWWNAYRMARFGRYRRSMDSGASSAPATEPPTSTPEKQQRPEKRTRRPGDVSYGARYVHPMLTSDVARARRQPRRAQPVTPPGGGSESKNHEQGPAGHRRRVARGATMPPAPMGPLITGTPVIDPPPRAWTRHGKRGARAVAYLSGTADQPLLQRRRTLPGPIVGDIVETVLSAPTFRQASLNSQALFLSLVIPMSTGLSVHRLCDARVLRRGQKPAPAHDTAFDPDLGILWCRLTSELGTCLAQTPITAPCDPVFETHWPLLVPDEIIGLLRLHLAAAQVPLSRSRAAEGAPHLLWVAPDEQDAPTRRPLVHGDVRRFLDRACIHCPVQPLTSDLVRYAEALTWLATSPVAPGVLPHLTGTRIPRLSVAVTYQAPTAADTAQAATKLLGLLVTTIRPCLSREGGATIFDTWLAAGRTAATLPGERLRSEDNGRRIGTRRHLSLEHIGHTLIEARGAARDLEATSLSALRWLSAVEWRVFLGPRRHELDAIRLCDVDTEGDDIRVSMVRKGKGDRDVRLDHLALPAICVPATRALIARLRGDPTQRLFPTKLLRRLNVALPHAARHALSTAALRHYGALRWTPSDWVAFQSALGHEIASMPCGQDDDIVLGDRDRVVSELAALYINDLVLAATSRHRPRRQPQRMARVRIKHRVYRRSTAAVRPTHDDPVATELRSLARVMRPSRRYREMVAIVAAQLEHKKWPSSERARGQWVRRTYQDLLLTDICPDGRDARDIMDKAIGLLMAAGRLETPVILPRPRRRPFAGAIELLVGQPDTAGFALRQDILALLSSEMTAPEISLRHLRLATAGLLLMECAFPDTVAMLEAATWGQVRRAQRILVLWNEQREYYVPLSPPLEVALYGLRRHTTDARIFPNLRVLLTSSQADPAASPDRQSRAEQVRERMSAYVLLPDHAAARTARYQRQNVPGWGVEATVEGAGQYRAIWMSDNSPIDAYADLWAGRPVPIAGGIPPLPSRPIARRYKAPPLPDDIDQAIKLVDQHLAIVRTHAGNRARVQKAIMDQARGLLVKAGFSPQTPLSHALRKAAADSPANLYANTAAAFYYLAYRVVRPRREWLEPAGDTTTQYPRPSTLTAYLDDLRIVLAKTGTLSLMGWTASDCYIPTTRPATTMRRNVTLLQVRRFLQVVHAIDGLQWWASPASEGPSLPCPLPTPAQIEQLFVALAADGPYAQDLILWAGAQLACGLRLHEASSLLVKDIYMGLHGGCLVHHSVAKDHESRWAPAGFLPPRVDARMRELVAQRHRERLDQWAGGDGRNTPEPTLLEAANDIDDLRALEQRLIMHMRRLGMHPHMLRHTYVTIRHVAAVLARENRDAGWGQWARDAADEPNILRGLADAVGHATTDPTRSIYDQATLWRIARIRRHLDEALPHLSKAQVARLFRRAPQTVTDVFRMASAPSRYVSLDALAAVLWADATQREQRRKAKRKERCKM